MVEATRLLLLGGTGEAADLARNLSGTPGLTVIADPREMLQKARPAGLGKGAFHLVLPRKNGRVKESSVAAPQKAKLF
jgi:hypothetical protein